MTDAPLLPPDDLPPPDELDELEGPALDEGETADPRVDAAVQDDDR